MPAPCQLEARHVRTGGTTFVTVTGSDKQICDDLASLASASLQSERGLNPADSRAEADLAIDISIKDIYLAASEGAHLRASETLGTVGLGTMLGLAVGATGGRNSALLGAGIGAAAGLGASALDAKSKNTWAMTMSIAMGAPNKMPAPQPFAVTAQGVGLSRNDALTELKEDLAKKITASIDN